jgi:ubiquitin-conjugating enzyme E2 O
VPEPYFNEAGFEGQRGSVYAAENSRMYNEMVVLKVTEVSCSNVVHPLSQSCELQ